MPILTYVDLSSNELSGEIPVSFCKETKVLALQENKFSGNLPRNLTHMNHLEQLYLHDNNITGKFPKFLSQISTLQVLTLRNNSLHGSLPSNSFSNKSCLRILDLSNNNLVGSIPSELGNLNGMTEIHVTPSIATDFSASSIELNVLFANWKTENHLEVNWKKVIQVLSGHSFDIYSLLDLSKNKLSGDIPASLGNLKGLKQLNISNNRISGNIPQSFGDLESIETLDLSNNIISGVIPESFGKLTQLSVLDVSNNKLCGIIPRGRQMDTMNVLSYFANNSGLCGMQIGVTCSRDEPTPETREQDDTSELDTWFLWAGIWIRFPLGFILSVFVIFVSGYFYLPPTPKYYSIQYRHRI